MKVKVKKGRTIYHKSQQYNEGQILELSEASALVHGQNVELVKPTPKPEPEPEPEFEPEPKTESKPPLEND